MARQTMNQAMLCGAVVALVTTAAFWIFDEDFIRVMGLRGDAAELAVVYFRYLVPVIPAIMRLRVSRLTTAQ